MGMATNYPIGYGVGVPSPHPIRMFHLNLDKIKDASLQVENFLQNSSVLYHVGFLQESENFLSYPQQSYYLFPPPRSFKNQARNKKPRASLVIHKSLKPSYIPTPHCRDICMAQIQIMDKVYHIISIYLPFDKDPLDTLHQIPENVLKTHVIIAGDVNSSNPLWGSSKLNEKGNHIQDFMAMHNLVCLNVAPHEPTFERNHKSHIDASFASPQIANKLISWSILPQHLFLSGHKMITFQLAITLPSDVPQIEEKVYDFKQTDMEILLSTFTRLTPSISQWKNLKYTSNNLIDDHLAQVSLALSHAIKASTPLIKKSLLAKSWWTPELAKASKELSKAFSKASKDKQNQDKKLIHKQKRKQFKEMVAQAKKKWLENQCSKAENPWSLLKLMKPSTDPIVLTFYDKENRPILNPTTNVSYILQAFFPDDTPDDQPYHRHIRQIVNDTLQLRSSYEEPDITPSEIHAAIQDTKSHGAPGFDLFTGAILKHLSSYLAPFLSNIFTHCINLHYFPKSFKTSKVITIPKQGDLDFTKPKSIRPISLLSVLGKVFEKTLLVRLKHLPIQWFSDAQFGFVAEHNTELANYNLLQKIHQIWGKGLGAAAISLDITSAFDRAWHPAIIKNLIDKGCPLTYVKLISSFLSDRLASLSYGTGRSTKALSLSTPQGSVLSPFLWNIFLDSLLNYLKSQNIDAQAFADDCTILISYKKKEIEALKMEIIRVTNLVHSWGIDHKATFNDKTKIVLFQKRIPPTITVKTPFGELESKPYFKHLGVLFDSTLSFNKHIQHTTTSLLSLTHQFRIYSLNDLKLPNSFFVKILRGAFIPKLFYNCSTWGHKATSNKNGRCVETLINSATRLCVKLPKSCPLQLIYALANIPSPKILLKQQCALRINTLINQSHRKFINMITSGTIPNAFTKNIISQLRIITLPKPDQLLPIIHPSKIFSTHVFLKFDHFTRVKNHDLTIFTNGSKHHYGSGSGIVIYGGTQFDSSIQEHKIPLPKGTTSFVAEVQAISKAIQILENISPHFPFHPTLPLVPGSTIHIYTDSLACLLGLRNPLNTKDKHVFLNLVKRISTIKFPVIFCHVPSHVNVVGNERADDLANQAALVTNNLPLEKRDILNTNKLQIYSWSNHQQGLLWHDFWNTHTRIQCIFPTPKHLEKYRSNTEHMQKIHNLILDTVPTNARKHKFNPHISPLCDKCNSQIEDLKHVLFHCTKYDSQRVSLIRAIGNETNIQLLLKGPKKVLSALNIFLGKTIYT